MFKGPLEDRVAISELHQTYADAVVRIDAEDWGKVWAEDARWNLMGMETEGREAIVAFWKQAMSGLDAVSFHCIAAMTVVDGDTAIGRCQTQEIMKNKDGTTRMIGGLYDDTMVKRGGQWLYSSRSFRVIGEYNPPKG
jgi:uncharacterized protein (TIGR02246 family)